MKTLVIYYSLNGNTQCMAAAIAAELGADLEPLKKGSEENAQRARAWARSLWSD